MGFGKVFINVHFLQVISKTLQNFMSDLFSMYVYDQFFYIRVFSLSSILNHPKVDCMYNVIE